jgi:hypothetical protein
LGLAVTLLGTVLAALKTIYTNILQNQVSPTTSSSCVHSPQLIEKGGNLGAGASKRINSLDVLYRMSPLAFVQCIIFAACAGELSELMALSDRTRAVNGVDVGSAANIMNPYQLLILGTNGMLAFALNYVSFTANQKAGPLTMTVAGGCHHVVYPHIR